MAHRALRGRYKRVIAWGLALALLGAALGSTLGQRLYSSTGLVRVAIATPAILTETDQNKPIPNFDGFIQAQKDVLSSREMIHAAMETSVWQQLVASGKFLTDAQFAAGLKVETRPRSDHLKVTFTNSDPDVAGFAVRSIILAFQSSFTRKQAEFEDDRLAQLRARRDALSVELEGLNAQRGTVGAGSDSAELDSQCIVAMDRVKRLRNALADVQAAMAGGPDLTSSQMESALTPEQRAADAALKQAITDLAKSRTQLGQLLSQGYAPEHRLVRRLASQVQERTERVAALQASAAAQGEESDQPTDELPAADLPLKTREHNLIELASDAEATLKDVTARRARLAELDTRVDETNKSLRETESRLDALTTEASNGGRLTVVNPGDVPMAASLDNRFKASVLGGLIGCVLPFGGCIFSSLVRRRSRFSMDVSEELEDRVPCVVSLPDLKARPSLALSACQGVHDLRLRLQPRTASDRRTLLVSSTQVKDADSGLSLSLALSFVTAGFRTLLVDANFASKHLSTLLCASESPGFGSVVTGGEPLLWRSPSGVAFLSAGPGGGELAHKLSPASTSKLLTALSDRFDVVIIDSDSVVSGLSAPAFVPLVDGVVLEVERGEEMALLRSAADQVESLGGVLAGVAFSKAAASEFKGRRSNQGDHKGQQASAPAAQSQFGPLVDAMMASMSLNPADDFVLSAINIAFNANGKSQRAA